MIGADILKQIEIHKNRLEIYNTEKKYIMKSALKGPVGYKPIDYSGMPHGSGGTKTLDRDWERLEYLQECIDTEEETIVSLQKNYSNMVQNISELKGVDAQVRNLRDMEGLSLQEIADRTKYDLGYIKQVSARNPRSKCL